MSPRASSSKEPLLRALLLRSRLLRALSRCSPALAVAVALAGCSRSETPQEPGSGSGAAEAAPAEGSAPAAGADSAGTPPPAIAAPPAPDEGSGVAVPPSLPALMRRVGFVEAGPEDLAAFVHLPPGAEGQAGVFGEGDRAVRVALIAYPNPRYVAPHLSDVQERVRVLPNPREAAVAHDRFIVHVMAVDRATADEVAGRIAETLGW